MLSLFGKDIENNVFLMLAFCDGSYPPVLVLSTVHEFKGFHYEGYFKFNNSVFTLDSKKRKPAEQTVSALAFNGMFWDMAYAAYQDFFKELGATKAKSLTLTR